jgi:hypothetical protein
MDWQTLHEHLTRHGSLLEEVIARLDRVETTLLNMFQKVGLMSVELDQLTAQVKANTDAEDAAVIALNGIAARIDAAVATATAAGASPATLAAITALSTDLKAHADPLAAAIVADTPAQA